MGAYLPRKLLDEVSGDLGQLGHCDDSVCIRSRPGWKSTAPAATSIECQRGNPAALLARSQEYPRTSLYSIPPPAKHGLRGRQSICNMQHARCNMQQTGADSPNISCILFLHSFPAFFSCILSLHSFPAFFSCILFLHSFPAFFSCFPFFLLSFSFGFEGHWLYLSFIRYNGVVCGYILGGVGGVTPLAPLLPPHHCSPTLSSPTIFFPPLFRGSLLGPLLWVSPAKVCQDSEPNSEIRKHSITSYRPATRT